MITGMLPVLLFENVSPWSSKFDKASRHFKPCPLEDVRNQFIDFDLVAKIYDSTATEAQLHTFAFDLKFYELWAKRDKN